MTETLVIRADASTQIGTGHVMRCLALAQEALANRIEVIFITSAPPLAISDLLTKKGITMHPLTVQPAGMDDVKETAEIIKRVNARWVVLDGYSFNEAYLTAISQSSSTKVLLIDDFAHLKYYDVDMLLNQNISAFNYNYQMKRSCSPLLGTKYVLLRDEFLTYPKKTHQQKRRAENVLVTMGGSDPQDVTLKVLEALKHCNHSSLHIKVIAGALNPNFKSLEKTAESLDTDITIYHNIADMPAVLHWADIVVSAAGSTCGELAFLGVPSIVIATADNQIDLAEGLHHACCAINLGWHADISVRSIADATQSLLDDFDKRALLSSNQQTLVDGKGAKRVLAETGYITKPKSLKAIKACLTN